MSSAEPAALARTPLFDEHVAAGARMVDFAGWEMPVQYDGIKAEHETVRNAAGIFDVSHMGQVETRGADAERFLQRVLTNDVGKLAEGGAQYALICREDGGVIDDVFTYRLADGDGQYFLTVTNAANHATDFDWLQARAAEFDGDVTVNDIAAEHAMIAVQGPEARQIAAQLFDGPLPERMRTSRLALSDDPDTTALVCGTGYTGEDGVEILVAPAAATGVWRRLAELGAKPAGLAARDTLRLEVCFHLYGNDLSLDRNPIESGLGWACKESTGFVGSQAVAAARQRDEAGEGDRLVAFRFTGPGVPRAGNTVHIPGVDGDAVGVVTSGTHSPSLGYGIGLAYLPASLSEPGTDIEIDVRGKRRAGRVESKPLYRRQP